MEKTPLINNGGQMEPVWFQPRGLLRTDFVPVVNIGSITRQIHADAIDDLIDALVYVKGQYEAWKEENKK